jgi:hypothetical protein
MARSQKVKHHFEITKNTEKQGAWLMSWARDWLPVRGDDGTLTLELDEIENNQGTSAWTTVSAAKRAGAAVVGRSRLTWVDVNGDGLTLTSECDERIPE